MATELSQKSVNSNYATVISIINFTVINKEGKNKSASLQTQVVRKKTE
jgi:hypothetical protein